ncbi:hypothetical protein Tco_0060586 [Tanacetum coccineum]
MLKDLIDNGPYQLKPEITIKDTYGVTDISRPQRVEDLAGQEKLRYDSDIKVVNILLLGLIVDIYTLINHYQTAKEIWDRFKELMKGTKMTKQERESMLYDEFDKFTSELGESIYSYYQRYAKLINDMKMIPMSMSNMQINTKFVNHLQPGWSRFVIAAKQARDFHSVNFDQLCAFLKHNEKDAKEDQEMRQRFLEPLALLANTYNPHSSYNNQQIHYYTQPSEVDSLKVMWAMLERIKLQEPSIEYDILPFWIERIGNLVPSEVFGDAGTKRSQSFLDVYCRIGRVHNEPYLP